MSDSDNVAKSVRDGARKAFNAFVLQAWQYLRPEGGERVLTTRVTVKDNDGRGYSTVLEMVETIPSQKYENVVLRAEINGY
jgi:hypothetical protein